MFGKLPFYHASTRKYVAAFGTLFNNIYVDRQNPNGTIQKRIKVPISYGPKEKFLRRFTEDPLTQDKTKVSITLPRIAFELLAVSYAADRKQNTMNRRVARDPDSNSSLIFRYERVPFDYEFQLNVMGKSQDDVMRIVEQILPFFTPDYTMTVKMLPQLDENVDLPIVLTSVTPQDTYEGDMQSRRAIIWTLTFVMKAFLYGPVNKAPTVIDVTTNFNDPTTGAPISTETVSPKPPDAEPCSDYGFSIDVEIHDE